MTTYCAHCGHADEVHNDHGICETEVLFNVTPGFVNRGTPYQPCPCPGYEAEPESARLARLGPQTAPRLFDDTLTGTSDDQRFGDVPIETLRKYLRKL